MAAIYGVKKGDILQNLKKSYEENFIKNKEVKWHVPNLEKANYIEKLLHKSFIREFIFHKEQTSKSRARIKEVRLEALREGFKECFKQKDFQTILTITEKIPQNILPENKQIL
jgi:hypothetical protein